MKKINKKPTDPLSRISPFMMLARLGYKGKSVGFMALQKRRGCDELIWRYNKRLTYGGWRSSPVPKFDQFCFLAYTVIRFDNLVIPDQWKTDK